MEKLDFLETWKMNRGSANATNHCGTFIVIMSVITCLSGRLHPVLFSGKERANTPRPLARGRPVAPTQTIKLQ